MTVCKKCGLMIGKDNKYCCIECYKKDHDIDPRTSILTIIPPE